MKRIPHVAAIMTPFPHSVGLDETLEVAERMMAEHGFRHLPVTEGERVVGLLAAADLASDVARSHGVGRVCRRDPYLVDLHERLDNVAMTLAERELDSAVVLRDGRLAGIVTTTDICRALAEILRELFSPSGGDSVA